jgi:hypothetical protein
LPPGTQRGYTDIVVSENVHWGDVLPQAAAIVASYSTPVTLRQLHYRLVAAHLIPNTGNAYNRLGRLTAEARRNNDFPPMADHTRSVDRELSFGSPAEAIRNVSKWYKRNRTEGQELQLWFVLEKATLISQIKAWTKPYGIPVVALRGYASTPLLAEVNRQIMQDGREPLGLYLGDHDPSGHDIEDVFTKRTGLPLIRLAVLPPQITSLSLAPTPGKVGDPRAAKFQATYGALLQVEVEAIDPAVLQRIVTDAVEAEVDRTVLDRVLDKEREDRDRLIVLARTEEQRQKKEG